MILLSKLHPPALGRTVLRRDRLLARFGVALERPGRVVIVTAPAGFGKTTLAAQWIDTAEAARPSIWLSLDRGDDAPEQLLAHLATALDLPVDARAADERLIEIVNRLADIDTRRTLILDDAHWLTPQGALPAIDFLLARLPANVTLVLLGRESLPLRLSRLRAAGAVSEFGMADLRFDLADAEALLNGVHGLALSAADVAELCERTDGWVTGLQLAAAMLANLAASARAGALRSFGATHPYVRAYFDEEVEPAQRGWQPGDGMRHAPQPRLDTRATQLSPELHAMYRDYLRARSGERSTLSRPTAKPAALSAREIEVLQLVARGLSNRDIARHICVAPGTVKRHLHNIFSKLNLRNRAEAAAYVTQRA